MREGGECAWRGACLFLLAQGRSRTLCSVHLPQPCYLSVLRDLLLPCLTPHLDSCPSHRASVLVVVHQARSPQPPSLRFRDVDVVGSETPVTATHLDHYQGWNFW